MEIQKEQKQPHSKSRHRQEAKYAHRLAFSRFVSSKVVDTGDNTKQWSCCDCMFQQLSCFLKHVSYQHKSEIDQTAQLILTHGSPDAKWSAIKRKCVQPNDNISMDTENAIHTDGLPDSFSPEDEFPWLPKVGSDVVFTCPKNEGRVLLYYKYRDIVNTTHIRNWQQELASRLHLTGKVRVASEGINGTVGGTEYTTQLYMEAMIKHPLFSDMTEKDFKCSNGGPEVFPDGLKVGVYKESCPMGVEPSQVSFKDSGKHLSPEEFHKAVELYRKRCSTQKDDMVFIDCRNFYESKIGRFEGAVAPDIRKFSYWPEYVDQNPELFKDKSVYMYCTGGIRCERGSAYLRSKGLCKNVYQLEGGIHKYLERFPDGFYRGKLFVFDDRYTIHTNEDILSACLYCQQPWDQYQLCSSPGCCQLVLSCTACREKGHTTCCRSCQHSTDKKQCDCTRSRPRIPKETLVQNELPS